MATAATPTAPPAAATAGNPVDEFELELNSLSSTKLPISASKIQALTKAAFRAVKQYKEVVHAIEKYLQSCPAQYKLPAIYVVDSVSRVCAASVKSTGGGGGGDKYKEAMHQRIEQRLRGLFGMAALCTGKDRERLKRLLDVWEKNSVFAVESLAPLPALLENLAPVEEQQQQQDSAAVSKAAAGKSRDTSGRKSTAAAAGKESPRAVAPPAPPPVEPPKVDVNNPHAQAMMQSLFAMMKPAATAAAVDGGSGGAMAAGNATQKAAKAAATISSMLGQDTGGTGGAANAVFDYDDDEGSASNSSDVEDTAGDGGVASKSKAAGAKHGQQSTAGAAAAAATATITPEEQMRSLLTAVQAVIPAPPPPQRPPLPMIPNHMGIMSSMPRVDSTGSLNSMPSSASIPGGHQPPPLNPAMLMNPLMMAGLFGAGMPAPHPHMMLPPGGGVPAIGGVGMAPIPPVPGMPIGGMPIMPAQMLTADDYNSIGRIRRIEPGIPQDSIRILSRTLYMGGLGDAVTAQQLEDAFRAHDPDSVAYNPAAHSVFIKLKTRAVAEQAKARCNGQIVAGQPLKIQWACGFGPKEIFDRNRGFATIADRDLKDSDRRWLALEVGPEFLRRHSSIVLKRENVSERDFWFGGVLCEEPDTGKKATPEKRARDGGDRHADGRESRESRRRRD